MTSKTKKNKHELKHVKNNDKNNDTKSEDSNNSDNSSINVPSINNWDSDSSDSDNDSIYSNDTNDKNKKNIKYGSYVKNIKYVNSKIYNNSQKSETLETATKINQMDRKIDILNEHVEEQNTLLKELHRELINNKNTKNISTRTKNIKKDIKHKHDDESDNDFPGITFIEADLSFPFRMNLGDNKEKSKGNSYDKKKSSKLNKSEKSESPFGDGGSGIPLLFLADLFKKSDGNGNENGNSKKDDTLFPDIKMPDLNRELYKKIEQKDLTNFVNLELKGLDDIIKKGQEFIDKIEKANKEEDKENSTTINKTESKEKQDKTKKSSFFLFKPQTPETKEEKKKYDINDKIEKDSDGLYEFFGSRYSIDPKKLMLLVRPLTILNSMIGMKNVKNNIYNFVSSFLQESKNNGMLNTTIYGKPGVGKTDLGKILCMIYSALEIVPSNRFKVVKASELIGQYVGQTRQKTLKVLKEANGGVLFIDEVYALSNGSKDRVSYGEECINVINQELSEDRANLVMIVAGYEEDVKKNFFDLNKGLERRFPFNYSLGDYTKEELKDIFLRMIRLSKNTYLDETIKEKDIINMFEDMRYFDNCGGDIENLITQISFANHERSLGKNPSMRNIYTKDDLIKGLDLYKSHKRDTKKDDETWMKMFT